MKSIIAAALIVFTMATSAMAQCGPRPAVVAGLAIQHGETVQMAGISNKNDLIEIYANETTGSWTALASNPQGTDSCIVAHGHNYVEPDAGLPNTDEEARN